ncbi:hypothetical protein JCM5353_002779 [Sporobolomyces roseus]
MNQDDFGVEAEQPPPAYVSEAPPAHHLFGALRLHEAVASITDSNAHTSEVLHDSLVKVLDEIINDRLASSHQPELGKVFETWKKEVLDRLDGRVTISGGQIVTHNYGFNYYYSPNWKNVISYFEGLRGRKDWKKTLQDKFEADWAQPITNAIISSPHNLQLDHIWYRVVVVLRFIVNDVPKHQATWSTLRGTGRIEAFVNKYKLEEVIAKMELLSGNHESSTLHRVSNFIGRLGGPNHADSSQTSLSHPRHPFIVRSRSRRD